jgi:glutaryl-CoA dehydrogenase
MSTPAMPYTHLGEALPTDYFLVREQFGDAEWERFIATRRFVDQEVLPVINDYWERADFPWPLVPRLAELGTYEGTETMQTLIVGRDITGVSAFA